MEGGPCANTSQARVVNRQAAAVGFVSCRAAAGHVPPVGLPTFLAGAPIGGGPFFTLVSPIGGGPCERGADEPSALSRTGSCGGLSKAAVGHINHRSLKPSY